MFKKIQDSVGGRVRIIITGSAPISKEVCYLHSIYNGACNMDTLEMSWVLRYPDFPDQLMY